MITDHEGDATFARLKAIFDNVTDGLALIDEHGRYVEANQAYYSIHGYRNSEGAHETIDELQQRVEVFDEDGRPVDAHIMPHLRALNGENIPEVTLRMVDERRNHSFYGRYSFSPITDGDGLLCWVLVTLRDVTKLKLAEQQREASLRDALAQKRDLEELTDALEETAAARTQQVQKLSRALRMAEQRERVRFSRILHEDLQQILLAAKMRLDLLAFRQLTEESFGDDVAEIGSLIHKAVDTSKALALEMNPPILESEGLDAALKWLANHMRQRYDFPIEVVIPDRLDMLQKELGVLVVQIVREVLAGAIKEPRPGRLLLRAHQEGIDLVVVVEASGDEQFTDILGDVWQSRENWAGMEERLGLFGGTIAFTTDEPGTMHAVIRLPARGH